MTSVQKKFAASLITIFIVSCTSYIGRAIKQTPDNCNQDPTLAAKIQECLVSKGITIEKLCITNDNVEVFLKVGADTPDVCYIIDAIYQCVRDAVRSVRPRQIYNLTISIVSSTPGDPEQLAYKGHVGTVSDPDSIKRICDGTLTLADEGTLSFNFAVVEAKVSKDAMRLGVRIDNLRVVMGKCKADKDGRYNSCLQVSGTASAQKLSESRVRGIIAALVNKYTGALRINTDNLRVQSTPVIDRRIK